MNRREIVRRLVLDAICDDYENIDQVILAHVAKYGVKLGWSVERLEIVGALTGLVEDGLAKAYRLSESAAALTAMPPVDVIEEDFQTYFYITKAGMALHQSDEGWPFDED